MNKPEMRINEYGTKEWHLSILHREDGPAVEYSNGRKEWWLNGKLHREDGPAIEWAGGTKEWYLNGKLHREDGPAVERASSLGFGEKIWYLNGKPHREDGPAVEWSDGNRFWYLHGRQLTEEEFLERTKMTLDKLTNHLSGSNLVKPITLSNGVELSIQASEIHYCRPQQNEGPWTEVEVRITHEDYWRVDSEMIIAGIDDSFSGVSEKYWLGANVNIEKLVDFINLVEEWQGNE